MSIFRAVYTGWAALFLFVSSIATVIPTTANAGIFSTFVSTFFSGGSNSSLSVNNENLNSQNLPLLQSSVNFDILAAKGDGEIITVGNEALMSESGPSGTLADIDETTNNGQISKYTVRKGDTLSGIAKMFGVSVNTIIWANNVTTRSLKEGQTLVILPVSGTIHTIAKGDTLKSIAKKYKADINEIAQFNDIEISSQLVIGESVVIPDGEGAVVSSVSSGSKNPLRGGTGPTYSGYYIRPLIGGVRTQGLHGYNGIDIGTYVGTPIMAAAAGEVIISRGSGWNGGYGKYVVISHYNGTQTLYSHLSSTYVSDGEKVFQGQVIGLSGNTGNSTGPHLHFEVRGAHNFLAD